MTSGSFQNLPIDEVNLDTSNPRIRRFLEIYDQTEIEDHHIGLALNAPSSDSPTALADTTTPSRLRESIIANRGIRQPIIVDKRSDGSLVCIEGNTRLWIYRDLHKKGAKGDWSTIPALVHEGLENESIDAIRLQAHLVGPRPWDAYSKARYLHELQNNELMPLDRIVALCGGNQRDVTRSIQAYADMEEFYRPLCEPGEFDAERFSGFVEYQSPRVQEAILTNGFSGVDFAEWIKDRRINTLQEVRQLPAVLKDKNAKAVFLKDGMKMAVRELDREAENVELQKATLGQLAAALESKANQTSMAELRSFKEDDGATLRHIEAAIDALRFLQTQITGDA
ncbi:ParB N-terminal domain-containing protein [Sulfitobacter sp. 1A13730]|uniref:ParB N-terminal domain-containing protein n=1 Tax=Sulfitobacter sp. 1A13730 TaxID=3368569 RepID=UPI003744C75B